MDRVLSAEVFLDVIASGSFSATANNLDMSRPMVTRHVENVENWLGARLLHRSTRKLSLTTQGESFIPKIEQFVEQASVLTASSAITDSVSGKLRIATSSTFTHTFLLPVLKAFLELYPEVKLEIITEEGVTDLITNRVDLAIRITNNPDPNLIGRPIAEIPSVLVAAKDLIAQPEKISSPTFLNQLPCILFKSFSNNLWHFNKGQDFESVKVDGNLVVQDVTSQLNATLTGMGCSLTPLPLAAPWITQGKLVHLLPDWKVPSSKVYLLYPSKKHKPKALSALIEYLSQHYQKHSMVAFQPALASL